MTFSKNLFQAFSRLEPFIFAIIVVFNLSVIFNLSYFPSIDGPAHLYNARLLNEIVFQNNTFINQSITLNPYPVPNWFGHAIMALLLYLFDASVTDIIIISSYLILLPYSFRYLIQSIQPANSLLACLIIPLTINFLVIFGFINFSIALIFYFFTIGKWLKYQRNKFKQPFLVFSFWLILIYFSHLFIFLFTLLSIVSLEAFYYFRNNTALLRYQCFSRVKTLILTSLIPFTFILIYSTVKTKEKLYSFVNTSTLVEWLVDSRPLILFNYELELKFSYIFNICLLILLAYHIISRLTHKVSKPERLREFAPFLIFMGGFILALYFLLPDSNRLVGFFSMRLLLLFILFILILLLSYPINRYVQLCIYLIVFGANYIRNSYLKEIFTDLNREIALFTEISHYIPPNSVVLTINYIENWLTPHYTNYLGVNKPMIVLDNYEIETPFFPLIWNDKTIPNFRLDTLQSRTFPCIKWMSNKSNQTAIIDYVYLVGSESSITSLCEKNVWQHVENSYKPIFANSKGTLYKINNK